MKDIINYIDFEKIDIRVGTVVEAQNNDNLNKASIVLKIDFGKRIGIKKSSAQLRANYLAENLINKQIIAITNFKAKQIGNLLSEVLVLGFPDSNSEPILVSPDKKVENGAQIY